ncbi:hypothetical protein C8245_18285 [Paracidovorax avenae]|uniref:hypothetical protein n=1 Tax=Paracidovorax avenae TaxID=80867 RepID=UPI000D20C139|nr:hypothetical protein [Paracidovorax avenae]AVS67371.1 hypothetical protein C8245_18285 [Paracidovorax avenae]
MVNDQARALSQVGENLGEYNRGVLTALGYASLYEEWASARMGLEVAAARRHDAEMEALSEDIAWALPEIDPKLHEAVDRELARVRAAWEPIQRLKDDALEILGAADPLGMSQAA